MSRRPTRGTTALRADFGLGAAQMHKTAVSGTRVAGFNPRVDKRIGVELKLTMTQSYDITDLLQAGIRAEGLRQQTIAGNVANVETPNYRRMGVKFEEALAEALESPGGPDLDEVEPEAYEPRSTPIRANGNDVNLEGEVGEMVKNSLRHKAYVRLLSTRLAQIQAAISLKG